MFNTLTQAFRTIVSTVLGTRGPYALTEDDRSRFTRYAEYRAHYEGRSLKELVTISGKPVRAANYLARNIDKVNYFAFGLGYTANHTTYQDHLALARTCWGRSKIEKLLRWGQHGSVCGDTFMMVAPKEVANRLRSPEMADKVDATENEKTASSVIRVVPLAPECCSVRYDEFDTDIIVAAEIRVPFREQAADGSWSAKTSYMSITPSEIQYGVVDENGYALGDGLQRMPNPLGEVYIVHTRNYPHGVSAYGKSDVQEQADVHIQYAVEQAEISEIISYHASPIITVFGAKLGDLVRGANRVWSGLPKDAKVEALGLGASMDSAVKHSSTLKTTLHELAGVPEIAQGSQQAISNTSGVALHTMYLPLIERSSTKQGIYGPSLIEIDRLILRWAFELKLNRFVDESGELKTVPPITKDQEWDSLRDNTDLDFPSPLPKDALQAVQIEAQKLSAGLSTTRLSLHALGTKDAETVAAEIEEERQKKAEEALAAAQQTAKVTADAKATAAGGGVDTKKPSVESGFSPNTGTHTSESDAQKGRPKGN